MRKKKGLFIFVISTLLLISAIFLPGLGRIHAQGDSIAACSVDRGLDIVFVMDSSGSMMKNDLTNVRIQAAKRIMSDLHEYDRAAVIQFNENASNLQSLTNNRYAVNAALDQVVASGGTDMSAGLKEAIHEFSVNGGNNHQIMIILTDGFSINNTESLRLAEEARSRNIRTYTIGLGESSSLPIPFLTNIANKTGGQYFQAVNAVQLTSIFDRIRQIVDELRDPKVPSNWVLTKDLHVTGDLVLQENMKLDANGYNVTVDGDLVLLSCSELRSVSGIVQATNIEQSPGSIINLNNSQLETAHMYKQNGFLRVNGGYEGKEDPEIRIRGPFEQGPSGHLVLGGNVLLANENIVQEGRIEVGKGLIHAKEDVEQKGSFDLQQGILQVDGNLTLAGGPLIDEEFKTNRSLNVNGGVVLVGSENQLKQSTKRGNITQKSGQLYVNHGTVEVFGNYTIKDGWLTMIKGSMDTIVSDYQKGDGDYVHVYRDFSMESPRNHASRPYKYLGKNMDDQGHLTDGVLRVDGKFKQIGDVQFHSQYSDRSQDYKQNFSKTNFNAAGRHKVLLTGKTPISVQGSEFVFNILEVEGRIVDYLPWGNTLKWNRLIERDVSANADLKSLSINDIPVHNFSASTLTYYNHVIQASSIQGPLREIKVDARADDHLNAKVTYMGNYLSDDGTAQIKVLVTAKDGKTTKLYTINVSAGGVSPDTVSSLELNRESLVFMRAGNSFTPERETIGYRVLPTTATNQQVTWSTLNPSVAVVTNGIVIPVDVGTTTIIAKTVEGNFVKTVNVEVRSDHQVVQGVRTLADFVENTDRYNQIMSLYDASQIGIVVPGRYVQGVTFLTSGNMMNGRITTDSTVSRVVAKVNGISLPATSLGIGSNAFLMSRGGIQTGDYVEVIVYNSTGDELESIQTTYPLNYSPQNNIPHGFYSIKRLLDNPSLFDDILDTFAPEQLRFEAH
ncbi:VWA domain-containing protein [Sporosarcina ureae]|uniref:VWFA domain-containing protein n=2 Tax=Sporosarcina ureae TaxID=1571 RepID=A0ABN4YPR1_SPOUR|nr:VWA domain-containing protein [Sporosarcina ureae]ARF14919.1 hypothetical protein SporoS204_12600 [Sporosarcina ureae]